MCKVYTDEGGIKLLYHGLSACTGDNPLTKAPDYLHVQADKPWYDYYIAFEAGKRLHQDQGQFRCHQIWCKISLI